MTKEIVISLQNVSKVYKRYHQPVDRLKEILLPGKPRAEEFWALQNVNLEIAQGESLGIIGRNGSGKSTLLQIIAGTLTPTTGEMKVNGRMSALLELGSGFNPEFTGRQNVFFNGRLLGLTQEEVEGKFDEIAAFADIGDFLDQPVKTYSSGMFIRLAFSVAVNVDPQILIVDEALAVGDVFFQQKCFGKMRQLKASGSNLLFVSHDSSAIYKLCSRAILLENGHLILDSQPRQVIDLYEAKVLKEADQDSGSLDINVIFETNQPKDNPDLQDVIEGMPENVEEIKLHRSDVTIRSVQLLDADGKTIQTPAIDQPVRLAINLQFHKAFEDPHVGFKVRDRTGLDLFMTNTYIMNKSLGAVTAGEIIEISFSFSVSIAEGDYTVTIGVADGGYGEGSFRTTLIYAHNALSFKVLRNPEEPVWFGIANLRPKLTLKRSQSTISHSNEIPSLEIITPLSSARTYIDDQLFALLQPYTLCSRGRLENMAQLSAQLNNQNIPGDFVECGTYKGGSAALLSKFLNLGRQLWLYDSFQGMPSTSAKDGKDAADWVGKCVAEISDVKEILGYVSAPLEKCHIKPGWFQETFQQPLPEQVALLHCDADWYESVILVLNTFYDRIPRGGCIVLDDFGYWEGCREAFYEFCKQRDEKPLLERVGSTQAYWIKT
ncbi:Wzt carbohydrate-binding domain-containing protein [Phormidium sp. FACHB-322]|uniref:TylF/MycF/NovP-related O-methyltransferase n=1 Tax=unclassified Phormidium TaxID=2609805 RepID=UPI0016884D06|nr:TylF/MycF/NovP-related O-methyltransferase [Leptolyngbya sp. FACHB-60]MBD1914959.1 Wzt carbohydrate-binding domain-containing protein [Phormidium sp. FACHB-77]MBD2032746.1 Wzt carbohydrate-binding domain-containing protein [Phormidium sp. FACHB-322]MBD2049891.1 Wzt carbohydrate-binding domain-containing protein [Leptolyngbya sp. FACHB-60]